MKFLKALVLMASLLASNASATADSVTQQDIISDVVCEQEVNQICFGNQREQISSLAAQVVSENSHKPVRFVGRKSILLAGAVNDGPPGLSAAAANRTKVIGDALINQGFNPARVIPVMEGLMVQLVSRGPCPKTNPVRQTLCAFAKDTSK